jgi:hypothetical protein
MWSHPDMLPVLGGADDEDALIEAPSGASVGETADATHSGVDWDAELSKLLDDNASNQQHGADTNSNASEDKSSDADTDTKNDGNGHGNDDGKGDETTDPGDEKGSGTSQS